MGVAYPAPPTRLPLYTLIYNKQSMPEVRSPLATWRAHAALFSQRGQPVST